MGIKSDSYGGIEVDSELKSTASGGSVYAAGDVLGRPFLGEQSVYPIFCAYDMHFIYLY